MKKRIVVAAVIAVLLAASAYAQMDDLFGAVMSGTPQDVQELVVGGH